MSLLRQAPKIVLAQSNIYEMAVCRNEGMRKLISEARVVPLGRGSGTVAKAAMSLSFSEPWFSDLYNGRMAAKTKHVWSVHRRLMAFNNVYHSFLHLKLCDRDSIGIHLTKMLFRTYYAWCAVLSTVNKAADKIVMVPIHVELLIWE